MLVGPAAAMRPPFTSEQIIERSIYVGSQARLGLLLSDLARSKLNAAEFWRVFNDIYPVCDDTWWYRSDVLLWCRRYGVGTLHLTGACKAFFDELPDDIAVYRGCSPERVRGLSWTIDRKVAEGFARGHRGIQVRKGTVFSARVHKAHLFTVFTARSESELIVDPRRLRSITPDPAGVTFMTNGEEEGGGPGVRLKR